MLVGKGEGLNLEQVEDSRHGSHLLEVLNRVGGAAASEGDRPSDGAGRSEGKDGARVLAGPADHRDQEVLRRAGDRDLRVGTQSGEAIGEAALEASDLVLDREVGERVAGVLVEELAHLRLAPAVTGYRRGVLRPK